MQLVIIFLCGGWGKVHSILSGLVIHNLEDACKLSEKACHGAQAEFILCYDFHHLTASILWITSLQMWLFSVTHHNLYFPYFLSCFLFNKSGFWYLRCLFPIPSDLNSKELSPYVAEQNYLAAVLVDLWPVPTKHWFFHPSAPFELRLPVGVW